MELVLPYGVIYTAVRGQREGGPCRDWCRTSGGWDARFLSIITWNNPASVMCLTRAVAY
jgi:hypothetical protein